WLPRGRWYDTALGETVTVRRADGEWFERRYLLQEVPVFATGGAVVPGQIGARRLDRPCYPHLTVTAYPGGDGAGELYEDDGVSTGHLHRCHVVIGLRQRVTNTTRSVRLGPADGSYRGWSRYRPLDVRFVSEAVPAAVDIDGRPTPMATAADGAGAGVDAERSFWFYDAAAATVVVRISRVDLRIGTTVRLRRDRSLPANIHRKLDGFAGLARRLDVIASLVGLVSPPYELHPEERLAVDLAQAANRITRNPSTLVAELRRVRSTLVHLEVVLGEFQDAWSHAIALPFPEQRNVSVGVVAEARAILATTSQQFG
ncbi:MAG TPA: DUF5110 domain-containing protein, partial [Microthrixaceae bacterium]|nr:DUF5110 domain-containing protein [Microthrixaceae bacterium]